MKSLFHLFRQISPLNSLPKTKARQGGLSMFLQGTCRPSLKLLTATHPLGSPRMGPKSMKLKPKPEDLVLYTQSPSSKSWQSFSTNP